MHPRTPQLLSSLVAMGDRLVRTDELRGEDALRNVEQLLAEAHELRALPDPEEKLIDEVTLWLAQAIRNAEREGPFGEPKKWIELARCFLPWVRADFAVALDLARPATTEQER